MDENKALVKEFVEGTRSYRQLLEELDIRSKEYVEDIGSRRVDGNILFQLELLQGKINDILYDYYLGDIERDYLKGIIDKEERERLVNSRVGRANYDKRGPHFSFGYDTEEFMKSVDYIYE